MSNTVVKNRRTKPGMSKGRGSKGGGKVTAKPAGKADAKLAKLARRLRESVLPGDAPFTDEAVSEAAAFLLQAAEQREKNRSAISLLSASDERRFLRIAIINDVGWGRHHHHHLHMLPDDGTMSMSASTIDLLCFFFTFIIICCNKTS